MELKFHTVSTLGEKRAVTPEGYLVCKDVPIGRTGTMVYGPNETPISAGSDGLVHIKREEDDIFNPTYMNSLEGKTVTDDHPEELVNPDNVRDHFRGTMMNIRRGSGMQADLLIADLVVMDRTAIKAVQDGKVEVSLGYTADYKELGPGHGKQVNLIGNHVALVGRGRCGNRCSIGDKKFNQDEGTTDMSKKTSLLTNLLKFAGVTDKEALIKALDEEDTTEAAEANGTHVHVHTGTAKDESSVNDEAVKALDARMGKIEEGQKATADAITALTDLITKTQAAAVTDGLTDEVKENLKDEANAGTADKAVMAKDSEYLSESFQETVAAAEILVPGIRIPAYDKAASPKTTLDAVCALRRTSLDLAYATADGRAIIEDVNGGKPLELSGMKCGAVRALFRGAVAAKKVANKSVNDKSSQSQQEQNKPKKVLSLAELNEKNAAVWKDRMSA